MNHYNGSLLQALREVYPEVEWHTFLFDKMSHNKPQANPETHRQFFDWLAKELNVNKHEDWAKVTLAQIYNKGGQTFLQPFHNSLAKALKFAYPDVKWKSFWSVLEAERKVWYLLISIIRYFTEISWKFR